MTIHDQAFLFALCWVLAAALCVSLMAVWVKRELVAYWRFCRVRREFDRMLREFQGPSVEKQRFIKLVQRARDTRSGLAAVTQSREAQGTRWPDRVSRVWWGD
jgi:hypothetical protein